MKKIEAVIRRERLEDVKSALMAMGYPGMTITSVVGHGRQKGLEEQFRGTTYKVELLPKLKIEIVAADSDVKSIVQVIASNGRTGRIGDGKLFVLPVEDALRIRTGETGEEAI